MDMRLLARGAVLVLVGSLICVGCGKGESEEASALSGGTTVATPAAPTQADATGVAGKWGMVVGTMDLGADGTGALRLTDLGSEDLPVTWREEGDHAMLTIEGRETRGTLSADGQTLVLAAPDGGMEATWVRVDADLEERLYAMHIAMAPVFEAAKEKAEQASCVSNMKQLSLALMQYSSDHDFVFPPEGADWENVIEPYVRSRAIYECPSAPGRSGYQLNAALRGRSDDEMTRPAELVAFFETDDGETVAYRHNDGANYAFGDGHVKWVAEGTEKAGAFTWQLE